MWHPLCKNINTRINTLIPYRAPCLLSCMVPGSADHACVDPNMHEIFIYVPPLQPGAVEAALTSVISKAEEDFRAKANVVLHSVLHDSITTLPDINDKSRSHHHMILPPCHAA